MAAEGQLWFDFSYRAGAAYWNDVSVDARQRSRKKLAHFDEARPVTSVRQTLTVQSSPPVARQSSVGWKAIALTASRWL